MPCHARPAIRCILRNRKTEQNRTKDWGRCSSKVILANAPRSADIAPLGPPLRLSTRLTGSVGSAKHAVRPCSRWLGSSRLHVAFTSSLSLRTTTSLHPNPAPTTVACSSGYLPCTDPFLPLPVCLDARQAQARYGRHTHTHTHTPPLDL